MMRFESDFDAISGGIMIGCVTLGVYINIICVKHVNIVHICFHCTDVPGCFRINTISVCAQKSEYVYSFSVMTIPS